MSENNAVLVTGSAGFIGRRLCKQLAESGHKVYATDIVYSKTDVKTSSHENIKRIHNTIFTGWLNQDSDQELDDQADAPILSHIFHLASVVGVEDVETNPQKVVDNNEWMDKQIIKFCKDTNTKIIFTGTSEVYGSSFHCKEDSNLSLLTPEKKRGIYAFEKLRMEYDIVFKLEDYIITRLFNVIGHGQKKGFVFGELMEKALANEPLTIYGDGQQIRTYMDIDECVSVLIKLGMEDYNGTYNIGNPDNMLSVLELAEEIIKETESNSEIEYVGNRQHEIKTRVPRIDKIKTDVGYEPKVSIPEMIRKYITEKNK